MRDQTDNFTEANARRVLDPRYLVELSFSSPAATPPTQNLLTYSEQFNNAAWVASGTPVITANSDTAPDGTTTADSVEDDAAGSTEHIAQTVSSIDADKKHIFSIFVEKSTSGRAVFFPVFELEFGGTATETNRVGVDLETGEVELITDSSTDVEVGIEDYDANYWRVWIAGGSSNASNNQIIARVVPAYGASATWVASAAATGTIVVWGAQLVTTDVLTPYSKVEGTADTSDTSLIYCNILKRGNDFDDTGEWTKSLGVTVTSDTTTAPNNATEADTIDDAQTSASRLIQNPTLGDITSPHTLSIFVKKDSTGRATRFPQIVLQFEGSTTEANTISVDTKTGEYDLTAVSDDVEADVIDFSADYWRVWIKATSADGSNTGIEIQIYPSRGASATWLPSSSAQGSIIAWGAMLSEIGRLLPVYPSVDHFVIKPEGRDLVRYFVGSHDDVLAPAEMGGNVYRGTIKSISGQSQQIKPDTARHTIGSVTFALSDVEGRLTDLINRNLEDGDGLNRKRVRLWKGHEELTSFDDYSKRLTYLVRGIDYLNGVYNLLCDDIQRTEKTTIFEPDQGALTKSILSETDEIPITIADGASKFNTFAHDANYSANPSITVGYIKIDDEIIAHSGWTDGTYTALQVVERGALNTKAVGHSVNQTTADQKKRVTEYFYLEGPAIGLIYALLTGDIYGQGETLPDNWHLGIDPEFVRASDFYNIGVDLWDLSDDSGRRARFIGLDPIEGKQFIERELLLWLNCFMPVYADGALGLRRLQNVTPDSGHDAYIDEDEIISYGALRDYMKSLINRIAFKWNWIDRLKTFSKTRFLIDTNSIAKHSKSDLKELQFKGVFNGVHSDADIFNYFSGLRDRYANPPKLLQLEVMPEWDRLEVGDTVRVVCSQIRDATKPETLDRVFEIQQVKTDWITGKVWLQLFGGIEKATEVTLSSTNVMADSYYTTGGTELSTVLTISGGAITANGSLTGAASNSNAIFYYDGNLTLNSGVTLTINRNVLLRIKGTFTINGTINIVGNSADAGEVGTTWCGYSAAIGIFYIGAAKADAAIAKFLDSATSRGKYPALPVFNILNPNGLQLGGIPPSISGRRGVTGVKAQIGQGAAFATPTLTDAAGGAGGAGGGGAVVVSRGGSMGASGSINTDGAAGSLGSSATVDGFTIYGQSGGGGFPGGVLWLIDGNYSFPAFDSNNFIASRGDHPEPAGVGYYPPYQKLPVAGATGYGQVIDDSQNYFEACVRIQFIPPAADGYKWMPEDDRKASNPRRDIKELLINNLTQLITNPDGSFSVALWKDGLFAVAGNSSGTDTEIITSPDGRLWTERSNPGTLGSDDSRGGWANDDYFVVCCGDGGNNGSVLYSTDGITWSKNTPTNHRSFDDVAYGNGYWVLVGNDDGTDGSLFTATSPDSWTERSNPKSFDLKAVCYSAELDLWVAGGQADGTDAYLITASDPTGTWTERSNPQNYFIQSLAAGNGIIVGVGTTGSTAPYIIYSSDGITWTEVASYPLNNEALSRVRFIDGVFYAVGTWIDADKGSVIWSSVDGQSWSEHFNPAPNTIGDVVFDGSTFVLPISINQEGVLISPRIEAT